MLIMNKVLRHKGSRNAQYLWYAMMLIFALATMTTDLRAQSPEGALNSYTLRDSTEPVSWSDRKPVSTMLLSEGYEMRSQGDELRIYKKGGSTEELLCRVQGRDIPLKTEECEQNDCPKLKYPRFLAFDAVHQVIYYYIIAGTARNYPILLFQSRLPEQRPERVGQTYGEDFESATLSPSGRYVAFKKWTHLGWCQSFAIPTVLDTQRKVILEKRIPAGSDDSAPKVSTENLTWQSDRKLRVRYIHRTKDCDKEKATYETQLINISEFRPFKITDEY